MSTQQYSIHIHDDFRIETIRFSRPEDSNELTLQADYRFKGIDSRDSASQVKSLANTNFSVYTETSPLSQYEQVFQDAVAVVNNYIKDKLMAIHFP